MATRHIREQATLKWFRENTMALGRRGKPSPFQAPLRLVAEARPESIALQQHEKRTRLEAPSQLPLDAETLALCAGGEDTEKRAIRHVDAARRVPFAPSGGDCRADGCCDLNRVQHV